MPRSFTTLPWKKTFRKLPPNAAAALLSANHETTFVACGEKFVTQQELARGDYLHLAIATAEDIPSIFEPFIPSPTVGPTSFRNATLIEKPAPELGWTYKTVPGRAPTRGRILQTHATHRRMKVRHQRLFPPAMTYIAFKRLGEIPGKGLKVFFQITEVLRHDDRQGILRCLNLLQENAGVAELRPVETAEAEAIRSLNESVDWEILPQEGGNDILERIYRRVGGKKSAAARRIQDRLGMIRSLKPNRTIMSVRGLVGYIAVEFCEKLTVLEHLEIDHAMFIAQGPAEDFIKLTRRQLTDKLGGGIERLVHGKGWEERLRRLVKLARGDQSANPGEVL